MVYMYLMIIPMAHLACTINLLARAIVAVSPLSNELQSGHFDRQAFCESVRLISDLFSRRAVASAYMVLLLRFPKTSENHNSVKF